MNAEHRPRYSTLIYLALNSHTLDESADARVGRENGDVGEICHPLEDTDCAKL